MQERANWSLYDSPRITFDNMRFGHPPEQATLAANPFARFNSGLFEQQIPLLADGLGLALDSRRASSRSWSPPTRPATSAAAASRRAPSAASATAGRESPAAQPRIEIQALWTVGPTYPEAWPKPRDGWTIRIEGDPSAQLHFVTLASFERRDLPFEAHVHAADVATAMHAVNAVPVCDAPPGLHSTLDLPLVRGRARSL